MKTLLLLCFISCSFSRLNAQKSDTLTDIQRAYTTAEQVLGLPVGYLVLKCEITISVKSFIFRVVFARDGSKYCVNRNSSDFPKLWKDQVLTMAKSSGSKISIDEIIVQKGSREMKWAPKSFIVP